MNTPTRLCPACARRLGALINPTCVICAGTGTLTLGAPALHHYPAPAVAIAIELHLEHHATRARTLPRNDRPPALEQATLDLRAAGLLAAPTDPPPPTSHQPPTGPPRPGHHHRAAHHLARTLNVPVTTATLTRLTTPPTTPTPHTPGHPHPTSAAGHHAHLAITLDPIHIMDDRDPPNTWQHNHHLRVTHHTARAITASIPEAARRRTERANRTPTEQPPNTRQPSKGPDPVLFEAA